MHIYIYIGYDVSISEIRMKPQRIKYVDSDDNTDSDDKDNENKKNEKTIDEDENKNDDDDLYETDNSETDSGGYNK